MKRGKDMWKILNTYEGDFLHSIQKYFSMSDEEFDKFLYKKGRINSPFSLPNMKKAIDRIQLAILDNEKIRVLADYDCDGITSASIMMLGLSQLTPNVSYSIPNRAKDGYGISKRQIDECIKDNIDLIISVDTGIAEHESIKYAMNNGIDVIVTDHHPHNKKTLPCKIVVDPYLDENIFHGICGAMVAYKVIRALIPDIKLLYPDLNPQLIALATIGTLADVMPLQDENRIFVYHGLNHLTETTNIGLNTLLKLCNLKKVTENDIGFMIAPLMNAAGRMEDASMVVDLFLSDDEFEAEKIVKKMISLNDKRKEIQAKLLEEVKPSEDLVIIQTFKNVPAGVLGIVANQISDKFKKPCFAMIKGKTHSGGSGRSIPGYNLSNVIIQNKDLKISGGGHAEACALSIENSDLKEFKRRCNEDFKKWLETHEYVEDEYLIDYLINFEDISWTLMDKINLLRPFGNGNKELIFCSKNVEILEKKILGKKKNALKFKFFQNGVTFDGICFNSIMNHFMQEFDNENIINIAYNLSINEFAGRRNIQLMLNNFEKGNAK